MAAFLVAFMMFVVAPLGALAAVAMAGIFTWHTISRLGEASGEATETAPATAPATVVAFPGSRIGTARAESIRRAA